MRSLLVLVASMSLLACGREPPPDPPRRAPVATAATAEPAPPPPVPSPPPPAPHAALPVAPAEPPQLEPEPKETPEKPAKKETKKTKAVTAPKTGSTLTRDIFVRDAPGKDRGQVMLALRAGTKVKKLAHKGSWVQISFTDPKEKTTKTGWVWDEAFANQDSRQH